MLSCGIPELSDQEDLKYVYDALRPHESEADATMYFTRYTHILTHTEGRFRAADHPDVHVCHLWEETGGKVGIRRTLIEAVNLYFINTISPHNKC